jgi:hypothetical protein
MNRMKKRRLTSLATRTPLAVELTSVIGASVTYAGYTIFGAATAVANWRLATRVNVCKINEIVS